MLKEKKKILIIDDELSLRRALQNLFEKNNYEVTCLGSKKEFKDLSSSAHFDLAIVDVILPDGNGMDLIPVLKKAYKNIKINILTGHGSIDRAIQAMKSGAFHFFTKPFSMDEILNVCRQALKQLELEKENENLRACIKNQYSFSHIIGQSEPIMRLLETVKKVSRSSATTLLMGESGTGKELVAKAIHFNSSRAHSPFIAVHCGAIPGELLESELFGHVQGAFTGAHKDHKGRFQSAHGGTLFLDEISTMPPNLQVKLLRVLQEKQFEPVGSNETVQCDVRVITATNSDLEQEVKEGKFREDLFYRLNVIPISIPPLRQRTGDIPVLLKVFISEMNKKNGYKISGVSAEAVQALMVYSWPGNIRELENLIERLCVLKTQGRLELSDLPAKYRGMAYVPPMEQFHLKDKKIDFKNAVDQFENSLILNALEKTGWNKNQAALFLKINRTTLIEKMKKKGIQPSNPAP